MDDARLPEVPVKSEPLPVAISYSPRHIDRDLWGRMTGHVRPAEYNYHDARYAYSTARTVIGVW